MENGSFVVVLQGRLKDGMDPEECKNRLAKLFGISPDRAGTLIGNGPTVIKRGVSGAVAETYRTALDQAGLVCDVEPDPAVFGALELENPSDEPQAAPPADAPACPKCGYRPGGPGDPVLGDECPRCGIIVSKVLQTRTTPGDMADSFDDEELESVEFPDPGFMGMITALEHILPETMVLPPERARGTPASLKRRFLAGLASVCVWVWTTFILQIPIGVVLGLMAALGPNFSLTLRQAQDIRGVVGLFAGVYVFLYLPWRWNGLTYGQRLMGLWVQPTGAETHESFFPRVLLRFLGTVANLATFGVLNLVWTCVTERRNISDTFSSSIQVEAGNMPSHPVREALRPLAYALAAGLLIGGVAAACAGLSTHKAGRLESQTPFGTPGTLPGRGVDERPDARGLPPERKAPFAARTSSYQVLKLLSAMQHRYRVEHGVYSNDLEALMVEQGAGIFEPSGPVFKLLYSGDLKMYLTDRGFEIGLRQGERWSVISEKGMQGDRANFQR
ncbi:RDD family protein [Syntrophobacter fumaroxidans]|uniref:RDD domain-containing protein n=1 Tax=Syntrophobacter fumaroxidans (strain DSM 10017 / MPOB) TaxID=335543 RepID=A0LND3_SYNFM|nr:RDD family protein [Syntrophobacter fumaroxidans]ABK18935.1 hypothetical protein Sfum_3262 [Syntrophobacter fumaroxidans MPOB]